MSNVIPLNVWKGDLQRDDKGAYRKNLTNLVLYLRHLADFGPSLRFNEMSQAPEWQGQPIEEHHYVDMRLVLEREQLPFNDKDIKAAVERVTRDNSYSPVVEYLESLVWDNKPRLDLWMERMLGTPKSLFASLIAPKVLISAVARAMKPGCKVDTVLVLEGPQGTSKSAAIKALFGADWTVDAVSLFEKHADMVAVTEGAWVVELAEFVAIANSDNNSVKGLLTIEKDKVRKSYAARAGTYPRRFVFFATINPDDETGYLTDATGNRRYWPALCTAVRLDWITAYRNDLWAEAVHRYRANERWWLTLEEESQAREAQSEREAEDAWVEPLRAKLGLITETTGDNALNHLGFTHDRKDKKSQMRVAKALKQLGFVRITERPPGGKPRKIWRKP